MSVLEKKGSGLQSQELKILWWKYLLEYSFLILHLTQQEDVDSFPI